MSTFDLLEKRRHVRKYTDKIPPKEQIEFALWQAWKTTPSKNQSMAYQVLVWGPDKKKEKEATDLFVKVIEQEKEWAKYLFKDGSMIGLNEQILSQYIEWIGARRMRAIGLVSPYSVPKLNPLPWTEKWIGGGNVQVAPQETEITSYVVGGVKQDVDQNTLSGLSL